MDITVAIGPVIMPDTGMDIMVEVDITRDMVVDYYPDYGRPCIAYGPRGSGVTGTKIPRNRTGSNGINR